VAVLSPRTKLGESHIATWDAAGSAAGLLRWGAPEELRASGLGSANSQKVGVLVFTRRPPLAARPTQSGASRVATLRDVLRLPGEVPGECVLAGVFEAGGRSTASPFSPSYVGKLHMGGLGKPLFPGSVVTLTDTDRLKWRVVGFRDDGSYDVAAVHGTERRNVEAEIVGDHL
jgi:hypothetical protein